MKRILLALSIFLAVNLTAQTKLTLQPGPGEGIDARVQSNLPDQNISNSQFFSAASGTMSGTSFTDRSLIDFDFENLLPPNAEIVSAKLSLYANTLNGGHSQIDGVNSAIIERISEAWKVDEVTWNNQPNSNSNGSAFLSFSSSPDQDYLDIEVTEIIKAMYEDPSSAYGMMIKLAFEDGRRSMQFGSSEAPNSAIRPKLEIEYYHRVCVDLNTNNNDARIRSNLPDQNIYNSQFISAESGVDAGVNWADRSLFDFDISNQIPSDAILESARLNLFANTLNGGHFNLSGSNESWIELIGENWDHKTVTWNNQPATRTLLRTEIQESISSGQDYIGIDMIDAVDYLFNDPIKDFGFMLRLKEESGTTSIQFGSSDAVENLRPTLTVCFLKEPFDLDQDGFTDLEECDDSNANINPDQLEILYNGLDDDCDPSTLDDDLDGDGYNNADDCDDNNPDVNPGQTEILYNGIDEDCDPNTQDDDLDQDGFGIAEDCDDTNSSVNPGQTEIIYNGFDDDCDPTTLDDDLDQDGFPISEDCDDSRAEINPDQLEIPYNGFDDDCDDGTLDDDLDQDGFGNFEDCDDNNPEINPNQAEIPYNGVDDDCDDDTVDDDLDQDGFNNNDDCDDNNSEVNPDQTEIIYNGLDDDCNPNTLDDDLDQDGFSMADDCDDNNADINPAVAEIPYNGIDDDCDPTTIDDDLDGDGFGVGSDCDDNNVNVNPAVAETPYNGIDDDCNPNTLDDDLDQDGFTMADDCDDNNANINPAIAESPYNGIDDDCDPTTLDDDLDQDGFAMADDCDDNNANINPAVAESPYNGIDDDCDPTTLDDDLDQDGFAMADDCDDDNADINPGQSEVPYNGIDEDCDPATLDDDLDQDGFDITEDCDDTNPTIYPGAEEILDNDIDEDCDGSDLSNTFEFENAKVDIFPNPVSSFLNIQIVGSLSYEIELYNINGQLIHNNRDITKIDVSTYDNGAYLLRIIDLNSGSASTGKIIISK